jgi:8-amino-3,8-dideoxy-alpha-D-manno-octulosonate transaminase
MAGTELFGAEERKEVNDVMESGVLFRYGHDAQRNGHWKAKDFEAEVRKITGAKFAHAMSSGSTAIATALAASGIGAGDEVIVPPFTFIASVEAVLFIGAIPVFAEIDELFWLKMRARPLLLLIKALIPAFLAKPEATHSTSLRSLQQVKAVF